MWRRGDRERFIGSYDPEYEMPDPDRVRRGRYQSDAYRRNFGDNRYAYRWNPDRVEERWRGPQPNSEYERGFNHGYNRGYDHGYRSSAAYDNRYEPPYGFDRYENWDESEDRSHDRERGWPDWDRDWRRGRDRY